MISKHEILALATQTNLQPHVVEKDYVLGWLLAGINHHAVLAESWVFKGGTCLKKCYFETYRFSEDLDFTLRETAHINEGFLHQTFTDIASWIYDRSGIEIPDNKFTFEIFTNLRGIKVCQGRIPYRGPVSPSGKNLPRIKLDLTVDEIIVEKTIFAPVRHDYSDKLIEGIKIQSYSYAEVFAEKIRALKERTRPRDLYDVINFFRRPESRKLALKVRRILEKKCMYKNISFPRQSDLEEHKEACVDGWRDQLAHQLPVLPPFDSYWEELPLFFEWLEHPEIIEAVMAPIPFKVGEISKIQIDRLGVSNAQFGTLELIRFAAMNRLCVEIDYRKENDEYQTYLIEPYSLRTTGEGHQILYGVKLPVGETRSFRADRLLSVRVSGLAFIPRYLVDFISP